MGLKDLGDTCGFLRCEQFLFWQKHDYFFGQLNHSTKLGLKWAGGGLGVGADFCIL